MLQNIRDKSSGWFSWVIIGIIVIVFALFGVSKYIGGNANTNTAATVNGQPISNIQVQSMYYQLQSYAQQKGFYSPTQSFADLLKKQALQNVIQTQALLQAASKSGFLLSPVIIQAAIEAVPDFQVNGQFSYQKWQDFENNNTNAGVFIQSIQNEQLLNQVQSGFVTTAFAIPSELKQVQAYVNQERHLGFFAVPLSLFSSASAVSLADQKQYYAQHTQDFLAPEQVKISYVELSLSDLIQNIKPTEQQLQSYYQDNSSQYQNSTFDQVKSRIIADYKQQQAQSQFDNDADQLANLTFSQPSTLEPAAKALGLVVKTTDYFSRQGGSDAMTKDPNVIQVAFSHDVLMNRNNSQVINRGNNSQVVIRVVDDKPASTKPFESVQADIQKILAMQMQQQQAKQLSDKISQAILKGAQPAVVATENHLIYTDLGFVSRRTKQNTNIINAGFYMPANQKTMVFPAGNQYYVVVLSGARNGSSKNDSKEAQQLSQAVSYAEGQLAYQLYQDSVMKNAKVKILNPM